MMSNDNIYNKTDFNFQEKDIANALNISIQDLDLTVEKIESSDKLKWEELIHYVYTNRTLKERHFSRDGLLIIAEYFDNDRDKVAEILSLIQVSNTRNIDGEIRKITYKQYPYFQAVGNKLWIKFYSCWRLLKTHPDYLKKVLDKIQLSSSPMIPDEDIREINGIIHYSLSGLAKMSLEVSTKLTSQRRKLYCKRVPIVVPPFTKALAQLPPAPSDKEVQKAMRDAQTRDKKQCQVTRELSDKYKKFNLCQHHLFDKNTYSLLAADSDNLISIKEEIHQHFHEWNGGTKKTCTIDDFIAYIDSFYSDKHELIAKLMKMRTILRAKLGEYQQVLPSNTIDYLSLF